MLKKMQNYMCKHGLKYLVIKLISKVFDSIKYKIIYGLDVFERKIESEVILEKNPKISLVCPLYDVKPRYFFDLIDSLVRQKYKNFEVCILDASDLKLSQKYKNMIEELKDDRFVYKRVFENFGIAENTNLAIEMTKGEYIGFVDHDDFLSKNALFEFAKAINLSIDADFFYSDEDQFSFCKKWRRNPFYKPDFSPHYLLSLNYICHMVVVKRDLLEKVGKLKTQYNGSQDYDFVLRATHFANKVYHINKVVYHWRVHKKSVSKNFQTKPYAQFAAKMAIENFLESTQGEIATVRLSEIPGRYSATVEFGLAKLTVVIYNKSIFETEKCVKSLSKEKDIIHEIIIVGEPSNIPGTKFIYKENLSKYENFALAIEQAEGEYVFLLKGNMVLKKGSLQKLLRSAQLKNASLACPKFVKNQRNVMIGLQFDKKNNWKFGESEIMETEMGRYGRGQYIHNVEASLIYGVVVKRNQILDFLEKADSKMEPSSLLNYALESKKCGRYAIANPEVIFQIISEKRFIEEELKEINRMKSKEGALLQVRTN